MGSEKSGAVMECDVGLGLKMSAQQLPYGSGYGGLAGPTYSSSGIAGPFTSVQMQELERQTMVYSYMKQSIPIPPELLFPIPKIIPSSSDHVAAAPKSNRMWDMGCMSNGKDPEPWRCRRTDGKKWRCSRNVAPEQKYCERHAHKNKPRSRKLVEQLQLQSNIPSSNLTDNSVINKNTRNLQHKPQFLNQMDHHHVSPHPSLGSSTTPYDQSRYSDWFTKGGTNSVSSSNQPWPQQQQSMHCTVGMKRDNTDCYKNLSVYDQERHHEETMNFNDQCGLFLGSKFVIDAWPVTDRDEIQEMSNQNKRSVSSNGKMLVSSLTLSMPGDNIINEEEEEHGQMGNLKPPSFLNWMNPGSWMSSGSTPGGPLAEALCLGITSSSKTGSNPESPNSSFVKAPVEIGAAKDSI